MIIKIKKEEIYNLRQSNLMAFVFVALIAPITTCKAETEMKTINAILNENPKSKSDMPTIQYIMSRCAGLNAAISKAFINETDPKVIAIGKERRASYEKFASIAIKMSISQNKSQSEGVKYATDTI